MYSINSKLKKWLIAFLAVTMAVMVALTCACSSDSTTDTDDDDDDTETAVEATDYQTLTNGDFEFGTFEYKADAYPDSTPNGWTLSTESSITSSTSSTSTSGIIDTAETDKDGNAMFADLDKADRILDITSTDEEVKYYNPRTPNYYGLFTIADDKQYDADDEDLRVNPNLKGTKILKISNITDAGNGTAQYFTSSTSLTIPRNQYAKLSVWVQTYNIKNNYDLTNTGAYISLTEKVNGLTYENLLVDNINTEGYWTLFEFYIEGSDFASTTISGLKLGLGHGNGSQTSRYIEGHAFFDNATFEVFETNTEYNAVSTTLTGKFNEDNKVTFTNSQFTYSTNLYDLAKTDNLNKYTTIQFKLTNHTIKNDVTLVEQTSLLTNTSGYEYSNIFIDAASTVDISLGNSISSANGILEDADLFNPEGTAAYFEFINPSSAHFISSPIALAAGEYKLMVFYTKLKITNSSTNGASISIIEEAGFSKNTKTSVISSVAQTSTKEDDKTEFGYWNQYKVVVYNATDIDTQFKLALLFGLDDNSTSTKLDYQNDLPTGHFALSTFATATLTEDEYNLLESNDSDTFKVTTNGKYTVYVDEDDDDDTSDSYSISVGAAQQSQLQLGLVAPTTTYNFLGDETKTDHGVFNTKYVENYLPAADATSLKTLKDGKNTYVQALLLNNKEATTSAFVKSFETISASSIQMVQVTLKAFGDAKAYVYLASKDHANESYKLLEMVINDTTTKTFDKCITNATVANTADGWVTVTFLVKTGDEAKNFRVEVYNGSRDGVASTGMVAVKDITSSSVSDLTFDQYLYNYTEAYKAWKAGAYALTATEDMYFVNDYVTFATYETLDVEEEEEEEETDDDEEEETKDEDKTYTVDKSAFLQVSSIIIAAVLLIAIVAVVIRIFVVKNKKKKKAVQELYNRNTRDAANEKISQKKAAQKKEENVEVAEVEETTEDYNYDEAQNVEETTTDAVAEENVEEAPAEEAQPTDNEILEEVVEEVSNKETTDDNKQE